MSLWTNLNILLDEKYAKSSAKDDDFVEAMEGARMVVQELSRSAKAKSEDAKSMVALLEEVSCFHSSTFPCHTEHTPTPSHSFTTMKVENKFGLRENHFDLVEN